MLKKKASTSPPTEHKKVRLAIQKEPPARPKAMADMNFFAPSVSTEPKRFRIVRPVYSVDSTAVKEESSSPLIKSASPAKKTVRFAEKLFEIREYEKNPEEWTNFVSFYINTCVNAKIVTKCYNRITVMKLNQMYMIILSKHLIIIFLQLIGIIHGN